MSTKSSVSKLKGKEIAVWVVEDNAAFRNALEQVIGRESDMSCLKSFASAEDALGEVGRSPGPDVILLDIELPGINGIQALSQFGERIPDTSTVIITAFFDEDRILKAVMGGASGYLLKTSTKSEIVDAVRQAAAGGAPMTPRVAKAVLGLMKGSAKVPAKDYGLSVREFEILELMTRGMLKKEIADRLSMNFHTVDAHLRSIYSKLHVSTRSEAVGKALRDGVVK